MARCVIKGVHCSCSFLQFLRHIYIVLFFCCLSKFLTHTINLIETPFNAFYKQSRPRSGSSCKSCLIRVYSAYGNMIRYDPAPKEQMLYFP